MEEANIAATLVALPRDFRKEEKTCSTIFLSFILAWRRRIQATPSPAPRARAMNVLSLSLSLFTSIRPYVTVSTQSSSVSCSRTCRYGSRGLRALLTKRNESIRGGQRALPDRTIAGEKEREILATDRTLIAGRRLLQSYNSICIVRKCGYLALTSICRALISANLHVTGILDLYIFFSGIPYKNYQAIWLPISILSRFRFPFVSYQIVFETRGPFLWESVS